MEAPSPSSEGTKRLTDGESHATIACETCRKRKSKCDEQRPRCGLCQKLNVPCAYQETKPTKKDNTLVLILQKLNSLNRKIDRALLPETPLLPFDVQSPSSAVDSGFASASSGSSPWNVPRPLESFQVPARQTTEVHKLLAWPAVQAFLERDGTDLSQWDGHSQGSENWLIEISAEFPNLAVDRSVDILYREADVLDLERSRSITLNKEYVESLCAAYFRSFHCTYPILDPYYFYTTLLPQVCSQSFSEAHDGSALVLLVLALGSVAHEGVTGSPIVDEAGRETGIRGGTVLRPPGLIFLTEAKRRLGVSFTFWNLNNLQCCILFAVYYSQVSRNLDFWRMAILSCTICESLVKTVVDWNTAKSDQIARCFWICCIFEGGLTGELGLEVPRIAALQDSVPLPLFLSDFRDQSTKSDEDLFIEYHFLAQITLRTLLNRARKSIQETRNLFHKNELGAAASGSVIQELSCQLHNWRAHLPPAIAWNDQSTHDIAMSNSGSDDYREATTSLDPGITGMLDFKTTLNASLRTRYKYAKYIIWRPYIFRVLHSPHDSAGYDVECCRSALKACTLWPLTFATFHSQRRLVPHIYEYTHTFFGILVLMRVCSSNQSLGPLLHSMPAAYDFGLSISLYLSWIRDMKVVHPVGRWCWELLKVIYKDHELVKDLEEN